MRVLVVAMFVMVLACVPLARAEQESATPAGARPAEEAAFDRAVDLMGRDALGARTQFEKSANLYEATLTRPLSQGARARTLYNLGTARQLAGDDGRAILAFRRADLLAPATPGLAERLAAIRSSAQSIEGSSGAAMAAGTSAAAKKQASTSADAADVVRAWVLSTPRVWLWWGAMGGWAVMWGVLLLRNVLPSWWWRPGVWYAVSAGAVFVVCGGLLGVMVGREVLARSECVVLSEVVPRGEPDDLTGQPAGAALRAGAELWAVEEREGGNGQVWVRVRTARADLGADVGADDAGMWVPAAAVRRVVER